MVISFSNPTYFQDFSTFINELKEDPEFQKISQRASLLEPTKQKNNDIAYKDVDVGNINVPTSEAEAAIDDTKEQVHTEKGKVEQRINVMESYTTGRAKDSEKYIDNAFSGCLL